MFRHKPILQEGQDFRNLPTYTIPEAAASLALSPRTLFAWYSGTEPLLVASGRLGGMSLLSFRDLEEAYKVHLLRSFYNISFPKLRRALADGRQASGDDHPLIGKDIRVFRDRLHLQLPARGRRKKQVLELGGPKQLAVPEVVDIWGKRISRDAAGEGTAIFPWRFLQEEENVRPVVLDPNVMSGRLVVVGTRIPVKVLWRRNIAGESSGALADDYGISKDLIDKALMHIGLSQKAA